MFKCIEYIENDEKLEGPSPENQDNFSFIQTSRLIPEGAGSVY